VSTTITVEPWPMYADAGGMPAWNVHVDAGKLHATLVWSTRISRFSASWAAMNLRRAAPAAYRSAVEFMREFCSKSHQRYGTQETGAGTEIAEIGTNGTGTLPRARAGTLRVESRLSRGTHSNGTGTLGRDRDMPGPEGRDVPIPQAPTRQIDEHKARMSKDPRFAAWVVAEPERPHALLWSRRQNALHVEPVERMLASNRDAYRDNRPVDYVVLIIGSLELCQTTGENLRGTLRARVEAQA
jgi:hypothetical protein